MTENNTQDVGEASAAEEARRRLKKLRLDKGMSVERLAALIERSPSSVRAHENGQNGISRQAADLYAAALGVSPSFLLWGTNDEGVSDLGVHVAQVPILGELAGDVWLDGFREQPIGSVVVSLPEYKSFELKAYLVSRRSRPYRKGDYVVVAPVEVGVRVGDHLVVYLTDGLGRTKLTLAELDLTTWGVALIPMVGGADRLGIRTNWNSKTATDDVRVEVVGPVVAYGGLDRPQTGPVIPISQLMALNRLG